MVTLAEAVNATTRLIPVSGDVSAAVFGRQYRIDDEIVTLRAFERDWDAIGKPVNDHRWLVTRGAEHSVAASHNSGVDVVGSVDASVSSETLAPPAPFASEGGGGAVSVTDGTTTVAEVTTLSVTGATVTDEGAGEAGVAVAGGVQTVLSLTTELTNADILSLVSTTSSSGGIEVLPAPAAGMLHIPQSVLIVVDTSGQFYGNIDAAAELRVGFRGLFTIFSEATGYYEGTVGGLLGNEEPTVGVMLPFQHVKASVPNIGLYANERIVDDWNDAWKLNASNGSAGDFTDGHADNWMRVTVLYTVVDLTPP